MIASIDLRLYLVTDASLTNGRRLLDVVKEAVSGGVTMVQVREKTTDTRRYCALAEALLEVCRAANVPLIVNDRVDIAVAVGADGVHLGQSDMPWQRARAIIGPDAIIGLSVENLFDLERDTKADVDYLAVSPLFATPTKPDHSLPWGLENLARARQATAKPLVAIGGINQSNVREVIEAGADGVAVVSGICSAASPGDSATVFRSIIDQALERQKYQANG